MMRSLYSGVSGLKTHQTKMDVIGNNIANVNTVAYKSQSITFSELMYQTTQKASGPNEATGTAGRNAKQIGLGVTAGAISTAISTQGSTQTTGNAFDLKITGDAFFVVSDGMSNYFTRDGSFYVDSAGNLAMSSNGYNVMGWLPKEDKETGVISIEQKTVSKLQILSADNMTSPPQATKKAVINGVIDKNDTNVKSIDGKQINLSFYDNLGYSYTGKFAIIGSDTEGNYILALKDVLDSNNDSILGDGKYDASIGATEGGASVYALKESTVKLLTGYGLTNGTITLPDAVTLKDGTVINEISLADAKADAEKGDLYAKAFGYDSWAEFSKLADVTVDTDGNPNGVDTLLIDKIGADTTGATTFKANGLVEPKGEAVIIAYDQATGKFVGVNGSSNVKSVILSLKPNANNQNQKNPFENISIDLTDSLNFNNDGTSTVGATNGDKQGFGTGCALGAMTGVSIQNNGMIYGAYDNGQTKLLGQIAVATFSNASGLEKEGDNLYQATLNSGDFDGIGVDITANGGYMSTGVLEMSNVDLSSEFTELITTQRGFQANSRIITVSDTLLEELVNLKR